MNNRMRQICKVQLAMAKDDVMAVLRDEGVWGQVLFFHKSQIDEYKQRYGDKIEIWGERQWPEEKL